MWRKFIMSRKFILALLITIFGGVSLGLHWLTGNEFVILASVVTGLYGAANIIQPKFEKDESDDKED